MAAVIYDKDEFVGRRIASPFWMHASATSRSSSNFRDLPLPIAVCMFISLLFACWLHSERRPFPRRSALFTGCSRRGAGSDQLIGLHIPSHAAREDGAEDPVNHKADDSQGQQPDK